MKMVTAKPENLKLKGITIEAEVVDGKVKGMTLTDADGNFVRIGQDYYNTFIVTVKSPPEMVTKWRVSGTLLGLLVDETFDEQWQAKERANVLNMAHGDVTVESVELEVTE